jgi:hypothetical protein
VRERAKARDCRPEAEAASGLTLRSVRGP